MKRQTRASQAQIVFHNIIHTVCRGAKPAGEEADSAARCQQGSTTSPGQAHQHALSGRSCRAAGTGASRDVYGGSACRGDGGPPASTRPGTAILPTYRKNKLSTASPQLLASHRSQILCIGPYKHNKLRLLSTTYTSSVWWVARQSANVQGTFEFKIV